MKGTTPKHKHFKPSMAFKLFALIVTTSLVFALGCKKNHDEEQAPTTTSSGPDTLGIYIPKDFRSEDFKSPESTWSYSRSKQSQHFIIFWGKQYGSKSPNASDVPSAYRVNIDDLLKKAEDFYKTNVETLKFAEVEKGKSNLTKYKMLIFLYYEDVWRATGSGYDDVIGTLWISPQTVQPTGSVLAHEIGHCFQYQVHCDKGGLSGFMHGFGGLPKNVFWEQTAQWQAFQNYPEEAYTSYHFDEYLQSCHRHFHHEDQRYGSYFLHYYWAAKHGIDIISKIWRQSVAPNDALQTYMRLTGINTQQLNDEIYDAATKFATWDLPQLKTVGANYIGKQPYEFDKLSDGSFQVKASRCPSTTGYNIVPLHVPASGTVIGTQFTGIANATGYNRVDSFVAGWRYGYVALLKNGTRVYSPMSQGTTNNIPFTVPENCDKIWLVVSGAPTLYSQHAWDDDNTNDEQWPYKVKFTNTSLLNDLSFGTSTKPSDTNFDISVKVTYDTENYTQTTVSASMDQLAAAFKLTSAQITEGISNKTIKFYAVESNGTLNAQTTANGYGHWFNASGNVTNWGTDARVFSEMDASKLTFNIGQFPKQVERNAQFIITQALVYQYETDKKVQATFKFTVKVE